MLDHQGGLILAIARAVTLLVAFLPLNRAAEKLPEFEQANRLYEQGKHKPAIALYESMIAAGATAPGVYFNLGNAHFKAGALGRAIYNYRRAELLAPRDPDIQANLRFARDQISASASIEYPVWRRLFTYFRVNELAGFAAIAFWAWLILLSIGKFRPAARLTLRPATYATGIVFALALGLLVGSYAIQRQPAAIVVNRQAQIRLGPLDESQTAFTAPDGTELRILARREGWIQVTDRTGRTGWIPTTEVAIVP